MSYSITLTNGTIKTDIADGSIDQTATDLTLIGKNSTGYGIFYNENLVKLLENFANVSQPNHPLTGQLWYDTTESRLKVYNGLTFVPTSGTVVGSSVPTSLATGEFWISGTDGQLWFNDGTNTVLAGPVYTRSQGKSGFETVTVVDTNSITRTVLKVFVGAELLGVFSNSSFTPMYSNSTTATNLSGFTGAIHTGFNTGTIADFKFNSLSDRATYLVAADTSLKSAESFVSITDTTPFMTGSLHVQNDVPLVLGRLNDSQLVVNSAAFQIVSNKTNQNFVVKTSNGSLQNSLFINATTNRVGLFTGTPSATLDVNGSANISGNTTITGSLGLGYVGATTVAGGFGIGNTYQIVFVGNTDFTLIGSTSNNVGTKFRATGVGTGTGTANLLVTATISNVTDPINTQDAATKHYVDALTVITVPTATNGNVTTILSKALPATDIANLTIVRVICSDSSVRQFQLQSGNWTYVSTL